MINYRLDFYSFRCPPFSAYLNRDCTLTYPCMRSIHWGRIKSTKIIQYMKLERHFPQRMIPSQKDIWHVTDTDNNQCHYNINHRKTHFDSVLIKELEEAEAAATAELHLLLALLLLKVTGITDADKDDISRLLQFEFLGRSSFVRATAVLSFGQPDAEVNWCCCIFIIELTSTEFPSVRRLLPDTDALLLLQFHNLLLLTVLLLLLLLQLFKLLTVLLILHVLLKSSQKVFLLSGTCLALEDFLQAPEIVKNKK